MKTLKQRLIGKSIQSLEYKEVNWIMAFTDGSGFSFYTKLVLDIDSQDNNVITDCKFNDRCVRLFVGENSNIDISLDYKYLIGEEFFVFQDVDGVYVVENGN